VSTEYCENTNKFEAYTRNTMSGLITSCGKQREQEGETKIKGKITCWFIGAPP